MPKGQWDRTKTKEQRAAEKAGKAPKSTSAKSNLSVVAAPKVDGRSKEARAAKAAAAGMGSPVPTAPALPLPLKTLKGHGPKLTESELKEAVEELGEVLKKGVDEAGPVNGGYDVLQENNSLYARQQYFLGLTNLALQLGTSGHGGELTDVLKDSLKKELHSSFKAMEEERQRIFPTKEEQAEQMKKEVGSLNKGYNKAVKKVAAAVAEVVEEASEEAEEMSKTEPVQADAPAAPAASTPSFIPMLPPIPVAPVHGGPGPQQHFGQVPRPPVMPDPPPFAQNPPVPPKS